MAKQVMINGRDLVSFLREMASEETLAMLINATWDAHVVGVTKADGDAAESLCDLLCELCPEAESVARSEAFD